MGYNGGINKRGYYRRNHNMISKSSVNFGMRVMDKALFGWTKALKSNSKGRSYCSSPLVRKAQHFNPKRQKCDYIIWGIFAVSCPIVGILLFFLEDWCVFFTIAIFGFVEFMFLVWLGIFEKEALEFYDNHPFIYYYLYQDEVEQVVVEVNKNIKLQKVILLTVFVLNLYPIVFLLIDLILMLMGSYLEVYKWIYGSIGELVTCALIIFNLIFKYPLYFERKNIDVETVKSVFEIRKRPEEVKESLKIEKVEEKIDTHFNNTSAFVQNPASKMSVSVDVVLPKLGGEYIETFKSLHMHGTLHVKKDVAYIVFSLPEADVVDKNESFIVQEYNIDKFILAYEKNWIFAKQLQEKLNETSKLEIRQAGAMGMNIVVTEKTIVLYLHRRHLPIYTKEECDELIKFLYVSKHRISEVRSKLFA